MHKHEDIRLFFEEMMHKKIFASMRFHGAPFDIPILITSITQDRYELFCVGGTGDHILTDITFDEMLSYIIGFYPQSVCKIYDTDVALEALLEQHKMKFEIFRRDNMSFMQYITSPVGVHVKKGTIIVTSSNS